MFSVLASMSSCQKAEDGSFLDTLLLFLPTKPIQMQALQVYGQSDMYSGELGGLPRGIYAVNMSSPDRAVVDSQGNVFVADQNRNRVLMFTADNHYVATRVYGQGGDFTSAVLNKGGISADSLNYPEGLALDSSGNLYVADRSNHRVLFYPPGATAPTRVYGQGYGTGGGNFTMTSSVLLFFPADVTMDQAGKLYIVDRGHNRVFVFDDGAIATRYPSSVIGQMGNLSGTTSDHAPLFQKSLSGPEDVAVDNAGNLYVADTWNNRILFFPAGETTATRVYGQHGYFGSGTSNNPVLSAATLFHPVSIAVDSSGGLYVADSVNHRVLYFLPGETTASRVYGQNGSFTSSVENLGGVSATSLFRPTVVEVDAADNLYVSDSGNNRVLFFPAGSTVASRVYGQSNFSGYSGSYHPTDHSFGQTKSGNNAADGASGISVTQQGAWMVDSRSHRVLFFNGQSAMPTGLIGQPDFETGMVNYMGTVVLQPQCTLQHCSPQWYIEVHDPSAGGFNTPHGIVIDPTDGIVFVSDRGNNRVLAFPAGMQRATGFVFGQPDFVSRQPNTSPGGLSSPGGMAIDPVRGGIYIADAGNNRVLYFK